jgi:hypothetical protein
LKGFRDIWEGKDISKKLFWEMFKNYILLNKFIYNMKFNIKVSNIFK